MSRFKSAIIALKPLRICKTKLRLFLINKFSHSCDFWVYKYKHLYICKKFRIHVSQIFFPIIFDVRSNKLVIFWNSIYTYVLCYIKKSESYWLLNCHRFNIESNQINAFYHRTRARSQNLNNFTNIPTIYAKSLRFNATLRENIHISIFENKKTHNAVKPLEFSGDNCRLKFYAASQISAVTRVKLKQSHYVSILCVIHVCSFWKSRIQFSDISKRILAGFFSPCIIHRGKFRRKLSLFMSEVVKGKVVL